MNTFKPVFSPITNKEGVVFTHIDTKPHGPSRDIWIVEAKTTYGKTHTLKISTDLNHLGHDTRYTKSGKVSVPRLNLSLKSEIYR